MTTTASPAITLEPATQPTVERKLTHSGNSYYCDRNGAYQSDYEELYDKLVPGSGNAKTLHGELIRAVSRLNHEYFNNGNCNAYVQRGRGISPFYKKFLTLIEKKVPNAEEAVDGVKTVIKLNLYSSRHQFSDMYKLPYSRIIDEVIYFILTTEDQEIPAWYNLD